MPLRALTGAAAGAAALMAVAAPLAWLFWSSGALPFLLALAAMTLFVLVIMAAGLFLLRAADAADMPAPAAWVLGVFATALAVHALVVAFQMLAATAFVIWGLVLAALTVFLRRSLPAARRVDTGELLALAFCAAATMYWCGDLAEVPGVLWRDGLLMTWTDQFGHGSVISQFGDPRAAGRQSILLADAPRPLYHYASYLLPAVFAWPLDLAGLTLATSVWVPLGFFTLCAGIYTLGSALAGRAGGVAALVALTLVPDPASYGLYNRLFGYYWYVIAVPGASYGVGICLLGIAFLQRWMKTASPRALLAAASIVAGSLLFRLHVFALALPALATCAALSARMFRGRKLLLVAACAAAFALFVHAFYWTYPDSVPALWDYLDNLHNRQQPTSYRGLYPGLLALHGPNVALLVGVLLILPASLGILMVLYPVSVALARRTRPLTAIDLVPVLLLFWYFGMILTAPVSAHGDPTELTQRPFVLLYAAMAVWTAAGFATWLAARGGLRARRVWLPLLVAGAVSVMLVLRYTVGDWRWAYAYKVAEGLPQAAGYMRSHWRAGDVLAVHGLDPTDSVINQDLAMQLVSLTGMPAYLSVPFVQASRGARTVVFQRYAALGQVAAETTAEAALARLRRLGIHWYVVAESDRRGPRWDSDRRRAVFVDRMVAVYSTR